jgi:hypothetical protein
MCNSSNSDGKCLGVRFKRYDSVHDLLNCGLGGGAEAFRRTRFHHDIGVHGMPASLDVLIIRAPITVVRRS